MSNPVEDLIDEVGCFNRFDRDVAYLTKLHLPPCDCLSCVAERHYAAVTEERDNYKNVLKRIATHEFRADRRRRGMVDVEEVEVLIRTARNALEVE
jgi:hypothetical protein